MKKPICIFAVLVLSALILSGCAPMVDEDTIPESFNIYASFLPAYMLSDLIVNDDVPGMNLHLLIQPQDGCMRNYSLSDWDQYVLMHADAVILIGSGFESFETGLSSLGENGPSVIYASSSLILDTSGEGETEESHLGGANPWLFLSADGGLRLTEAIAANMIVLDPDYEAVYMENLNRAYEKFETLTAAVKTISRNADHDKRVALAHEGLVYTANDFELNVVLRIDRESGEYPDAAQMKDVLNALSESGAEIVLVENHAPEAFTAPLEEAGYEVLFMNTLSAGNVQDGADAYFELMMENAQRIERAFKK